jgi:hypothetical protein
VSETVEIAPVASSQQKDNLCGPFQAARILRELGYDADEDELAVRAESVLPNPSAGSVPPGAESRTAYRYELATAQPAEAGTAVAPLAGAIEAASGGALRCVPIRGTWTPRRIEWLVERATRAARLIANVRTGHFWATRPPVEALVAELERGDAEAPPAEWDVGHFCELVRVVRGTGGSLVVVRDSYPSFGLAGYHLQPPRAVAAALDRGDGREGGVLAVAERENAHGLEALAEQLGLELGHWDNGTRTRR